jgi:hypothetical protein
MLRLAFARSLDFSMEMWKYAVSLKQPVEDARLSFAHRPNRTAFLMGARFPPIPRACAIASSRGTNRAAFTVLCGWAIPQRRAGAFRWPAPRPKYWRAN